MEVEMEMEMDEVQAGAGKLLRYTLVAIGHPFWGLDSDSSYCMYNFNSDVHPPWGNEHNAGWCGMAWGGRYLAVKTQPSTETRMSLEPWECRSVFEGGELARSSSKSPADKKTLFRG